MFVFLLLSVLTLVFNVGLVRAQIPAAVTINSDGSVSPYDAPISSVDNVTYTFTGNVSYPIYYGIVVERSNIVIDGNGYTVQGNSSSTPYSLNYSGNGLSLTGISNVTVKNANIENFQNGIYLSDSNNNTISANNATANEEGIYLSSSSNNTVSMNNAAEETSNTTGIYLVSSNYNTVTGNNATANNVGILVESSNDSTISGNEATEDFAGIYLSDASNNLVSGNNVGANADEGIYLGSSSNNSVSANNVTANRQYGIWLDSSSNNNTIYHNNFIGNSVQASVSLTSVGNVWNNGYPSGGNYWSDYNGTDLYSGPYQNVTGSDGIGDTPYVIDANNTDSYPLMGVYYEFFPAFFSNSTVSVVVISNSTVSDLTYTIWLSSPYDGFQPGQPQIGFLSSGQNGNTSFCRIMIPRAIFSNSSSYTVYVDSQPVNATELRVSNSTYVYLYFTYTQPTQQIIVTIPEFSSLILPLLMLATLLAIAINKKRHNRS
jgi:parallel beta-helix repeat protein